MTIAIIVLAVFFYSLCAHVTYRLFNRYDPSSNYNDERTNSLDTGLDTFTAKELHDNYIAAATFFWLISLLIWTLFYLPRLIVLRVERSLDKPPTTGPDRPYR